MCSTKLLATPIQLGGPGGLVPIDESLFCRKPKVRSIAINVMPYMVHSLWRVKNTSLSHWYTWPAHSATTVASSAAWPDGYSLIHQCIRSSHCCRVSLDLAKKLPSPMERVFWHVVTGHLHLKQCNLCLLFLFAVLYSFYIIMCCYQLAWVLCVNCF